MNQKTELIDTNTTGNPTSLPSPYAGMCWYDTTNNIIKFRNAANNAWSTQISEGVQINQSLLTTSSPAFAGLTVGGSSVITAASEFITSVDTNYFSILSQELKQTFLNIGTSEPAGPTTGMLYVETTTGLVKVYANSAWNLVEYNYLSSQPNGFPVNTSGSPNPSNQTTISFTATGPTRTFSIAPTGASFSVYVHGVEYTFTTAQTVTITNTEGLWYIYFNSSGVLTASQSLWSLENNATVAYINWDSTNLVATFFADERHMFTMDWRTHYYLHTSIGTRYVSGLTISGYTLNTDTDAGVEIGLSSGTVFDEDIEMDIANGTSGTPASTSNFYNQPITKPATIPVYYQIGATGVWRKQTITNFYMIVDATNKVLYYNLNSAGTWSLADVTSGHYMSMWIFATNDIDNPIIAIMGQLDSSTLANAQVNDTFTALSIASGLPFLEMKLLYQIILQTRTSFGGTNYCKVQAVNDFRTSNIGGTATAGTGYITSVGLGFLVSAGNLALNSTLWSIDGSGNLTVDGSVIINIGSSTSPYSLKFTGLSGMNEADLFWVPFGSLSVTNPQFVISSLRYEGGSTQNNMVMYFYDGTNFANVLVSTLVSTGKASLASQNNTLDDGSGNATFIGTINSVGLKIGNIAYQQNNILSYFGIVLYLPMDEGSGSVAYDLSGYNNNGTIQNSPTWVTGMYGGGIGFNTTSQTQNQFIDVPTKSSICIGGPFTVSLWWYPTSYGSTEILFRKAADTTPHNNYYAYNGGGLNFQFHDTGNTSHSISYAISNTNTPLNKWHHFVFVWDGTYQYIYIDTVQVAISSSLAGVIPISTSGTDLFVGTYSNSYAYPLIGNLDEFRLFNRALSANEILSLYNRGAMDIPETLINQSVALGSSPSFLTVTATAGLITDYLTGNYAGWTSLPSFPTPTNGMIVLLWDTSVPAGRIYCYVGSGWHYATLT
jgi:hypothetical protein